MSEETEENMHFIWGAVGEVEASPRGKCSYIISYRGCRSLKHTLLVTKHTEMHLVACFIYRLSQLLCMSCTFFPPVWHISFDHLLPSLLWFWLPGQMRPSIRGVWAPSYWAAPSSSCRVELHRASAPSASFRPDLPSHSHWAGLKNFFSPP